MLGYFSPLAAHLSIEKKCRYVNVQVFAFLPHEAHELLHVSNQTAAAERGPRHAIVVLRLATSTRVPQRYHQILSMQSIHVRAGSLRCTSITTRCRVVQSKQEECEVDVRGATRCSPGSMRLVRETTWNLLVVWRFHHEKVQAVR